MIGLIASPLVKLVLVGGLVAGAYVYGRMDGGRLAEARNAAAVVEAQRRLHRAAEEIAELRVEAGEALTRAEAAERRARRPSGLILTDEQRQAVEAVQ